MVENRSNIDMTNFWNFIDNMKYPNFVKQELSNIDERRAPEYLSRITIMSEDMMLMNSFTNHGARSLFEERMRQMNK